MVRADTNWVGTYHSDRRRDSGAVRLELRHTFLRGPVLRLVQRAVMQEVAASDAKRIRKSNAARSMNIPPRDSMLCPARGRNTQKRRMAVVFPFGVIVQYRVME